MRRAEHAGTVETCEGRRARAALVPLAAVAVSTAEGQNCTSGGMVCGFAAEAMINGIPALVSNRGALPHVVGGDFADDGGGRVLPIPEWMTYQSTELPTEREVDPWYQAVCALWDDGALYASMAARAREIAHTRYSEQVSRRLQLEYFASLTERGHPIDPE